MKGFTLIEVLVALLIVVGSALFLLKAIVSTQQAIVFSDHKQKATFLLQERIEDIIRIEWATVTTGQAITDDNINWQIGGTLTRNIGPISFIIIPGTQTGIGPGIGRPSIESQTLDRDEKGIAGGTFTVSCAWLEDNRWATVTNTSYIAMNRSLFEPSESFKEE